MPIFIEEIASENTEVLGYYHNNKLVAFSMNYMYTTSNVVVAEQFAWDYQTPKLRLGIRSIQNECARYKRMGYQYLYLGEYATYKEQFQGFEIVRSLE
jgi:arginyl-tRNA--protein-N-Asp/Glu arginylyltransferase